MGFFSNILKGPDNFSYPVNFTKQLVILEKDFNLYERYYEELLKYQRLKPEDTKYWLTFNKEVLNARFIAYINATNIPNNIDISIKIAQLYCNDFLITPKSFFGIMLYSSLYNDKAKLLKYSDVILNYIDQPDDERLYEKNFCNPGKKGIDYGKLLGSIKIGDEWDHGDFFTKGGSYRLGIDYRYYGTKENIWYYKYKLLIELTKYDDALEYLQECINRKGENFDILLLKIQTLELIGEKKEALSLLDFLIFKYPDSILALQKRFELLLKVDEFESALKDISEILSKEPTLENKKLRDDLIQKINEKNQNQNDFQSDIEIQLKMKYAKGEITEEEYLKKRKILELD